MRIYASHIENANFLRTHRQDWILKLNTSPEFVDVDPEYLIALDASGRIVGHNRRAHEMLAAEVGAERAGEAAASLIGAPFDTLFDARLDDLGRFVYSRPSELRAVPLAKSGALLYLSVMPPAPCWQPAQRNAASRPRVEDARAARRALRRRCRAHASTANARRSSSIRRSTCSINGETGSGKEYLREGAASGERAARAGRSSR